VSLDDGAIDARSEAKIIGIDDQPAHRVSLAGIYLCTARIVVLTCRRRVPHTGYWPRFTVA
jgi:hypothetical protein